MKKKKPVIPKGYYCDNTHEQNKTVCMVCYNAGYRYASPKHPRVWRNPLNEK